ncbi:hypothetical protein MNEG_1323 [Monoraphidium neglectum]|uniref:Uncharacterized protein n=1 Tax=Monoraphidium neglectum TaxID=145388 RepID=A0A0D2NQN3_9CHLO|nr:hypothetical protein MNEG_1323 [Monoraphidium neglectum]KIZ06621.1 hypothetical protein MNEG_1323 [Monoraphidium neglectum]|eukprot:XP_013905640.1 hypothetical protein MNEG_1323 [Monoraphidium neglectum]
MPAPALICAQIQISIKLLEKLAGIKREEPQQQRRPQRGPQGAGLGRLPLTPPDMTAFSLDPELRGALAASRRVGSLLLKAEEQEMEKVAAAADDLIRREYSTPAREVPCQRERDACINCYQHHKQDAWACAEMVDAYASCASAAYQDLTA